MISNLNLDNVALIIPVVCVPLSGVAARSSSLLHTSHYVYLATL